MEKTVDVLKVLADGTRIKILMLLSRQEMAVCELIETLSLSQPAVSHHLKLLKHAGLVQDNRVGKWIYYTINEHNFAASADFLKDFLETVQENLRKGVLPSRIRTEPCLCEEMKTKPLPRKQS